MNKINLMTLISICIIPAMLSAMDSYVRFNIGGHKFIVDKNLERLNESIILQNPEQSPFYKNLDSEGSHFFDLCSEEGRILEHYLRYGTLKRKNKSTLKKTGEHFDLKKFPALISEMSTVKKWDFVRCPICNSYVLTSLLEGTKHMVEEHDANVHGGYFEKSEGSFKPYVALYYSNADQETKLPCRCD